MRYTKDKKRNWGNVLQCTHYLEVANWVHNCRELHQHVQPIVAAFVGYNHDLGEDFRQDVTPRRIVDECWRGDPALKEYLIDILSKLTDPPELHGKERLRKQIDDAQKMGDLGNYARFADKWCSLKRDLWSLQERKKVFSELADKDKYFQYLHRRSLVVEGLRVDSRYKDEFHRLKEEIEGVVNKQMSANNAAINSFRKYGPQIVLRCGNFGRRMLVPVAHVLEKANRAVGRATGLML